MAAAVVIGSLKIFSHCEKGKLLVSITLHRSYRSAKSTHNTFLASFLLGWEYHPGSWFYLAYNEGREDVNSPFAPIRDFMMTNRTIIAKLSYAIHK